MIAMLLWHPDNRVLPNSTVHISTLELVVI